MADKNGSENAMRLLKLMVALGGVLMAGAALGQVRTPAADTQPKAVVELFTSQGCSSCPAADALLKTYAERPDVIALSLPVDYWDYLGWKDTLASSKFTERQRAYAKMRGDGRIYTPQIVVNGLMHVNGAHADEIDHAIAKTTGKLAGERIPVTLSSAGDKLTIETGPVADGDKAKAKDGTVWLAVIQKEAHVPIKAGENRGRTLTYCNVVREMKSVGTWSDRPTTITVDRNAISKPSAESYAVLLQSGVTGPIVGAAYLSK
jgi:hypothetical protein